MGGNVFDNVCLILTCTVDVRGIVFMERSETESRLCDYQTALSLWLKNSEVQRIIFAENSGFDLSSIKELVEAENTTGKLVEFLSFDGQDFPRQLGKGYGENITLQYVSQYSQLLKKSGRFVKVNGRYYVSNIGAVMSQITPDVEVVCDLSRNLSWADSRVFGGTREFLKKYLCPEGFKVNDSKGLFLEHALARAVHRAIADGRRWSFLPCVPKIRGISGTANIPYRNSHARGVAKSIVWCMKRFLFAR